MNIHELHAENNLLREVIKEQNEEIERLETKLNAIESFIENYITNEVAEYSK